MQKSVLAIGGNAISPPDKRESAQKRIQRLKKVIDRLKPIFKKYRVLITHGNGFDVGELSNTSSLPLDTLDAMTQGQLGYWLQHTLTNVLKKPAATIITRVLVDPKDKAFQRPTKPIGRLYKGRRRRVPSPKPLKILEAKIIQKLFDAGFVVIAGGGGGIPVVRKKNKCVGVEAVIDKDLCAVELAKLIGADTLLILTNVEGVYLNFGKPGQKKLKTLTAKEAQKFLKENQFGIGSMKPKIEAALSFLKSGGKKCFIGSLEKGYETIQGHSGTKITLENSEIF